MAAEQITAFPEGDTDERRQANRPKEVHGDNLGALGIGGDWQAEDTTPRGRRDRSGRVPRASRALTFQQSWTQWNTNGPDRPIQAPRSTAAHNELYNRSDEIRGQGL